MKNLEIINTYLRKYKIESVFPEEVQHLLSLDNFAEGEVICSQGQLAKNLYILVEGKIKVYTTSAEGRTLILSFKNPVEIIGDIEYIRGIDIINTVEAVSAVSMISVPYAVLKKYAKDHAPLLNFLLDIITEKFQLKNSSLTFNLFYPVEVRLASYLLSVSSQEMESPDGEKGSMVHIRDAANLIGTSYRHVNRVIQKFLADGLIERQRGSIYVKSREGLKRLAGDNIYE
ncbi:Crp/Fnr family transcriptional regulator [Niallia nealsonii]|uniref:Crp/Fnr family transcriptional regulator n=1 Tax=Niallia nealsonii TaxID=115979 RepID=A0A2N0YYK3_9BACI|nr:Crp/Fnr family transcriptional regulator [Niallia nealsonii]PKG22332.1 Crp/Fnr family transcriptional regulator [Niallia nealsonii]